MPVAYIRPLGESGLYFIQTIDAVDPGYGRPGGPRPDNSLPGGGPVDPGWGVRPPVDPGYGRPGFGAGRPDNTLPGGPGHPDVRPPGRPPVVASGDTLVLVKDPEGVWHYATFDASTPPPKPVPVPPPTYPTTGPVPPVVTPV